MVAEKRTARRSFSHDEDDVDMVLFEELCPGTSPFPETCLARGPA